LHPLTFGAKPERSQSAPTPIYIIEHAIGPWCSHDSAVKGQTATAAIASTRERTFAALGAARLDACRLDDQLNGFGRIDEIKGRMNVVGWSAHHAWVLRSCES